MTTARSRPARTFGSTTRSPPHTLREQLQERLRRVLHFLSLRHQRLRGVLLLRGGLRLLHPFPALFYFFAGSFELDKSLILFLPFFFVVSLDVFALRVYFGPCHPRSPPRCGSIRHSTDAASSLTQRSAPVHKSNWLGGPPFRPMGVCYQQFSETIGNRSSDSQRVARDRN
jgi:hypothetical protein